MQDQTNNSALKRVVLVVGGLILLVGIAYGVVFLLKNVMPKATTSLTPTQVTPAAPAEVIANFTTPDTIKGLSTYQLQTTSTGDAYIIYRSGNYSYTISTPTKLQAIFYAKEKGKQDDKKTIEEQATTFMQSKGYDKINNTGPASAENPSYVTFASSEAVCQLVNTQPADATMLAYYSIACVEKSAIDQEYVAVEKLLGIYKQSQQPPTFEEAVRTAKTEGDKSFAIVTLGGADQHSALLFVAIGDAWTYVGNLNSTIETNGKYSISSEIRKVINDPKYGDFLKKNIQ